MSMKIKYTRNGRKDERGAVLAMTAIGALAFLMAAGLAIDVSHFYTVGTELQNAADASAIAGASALNHTAKGIIAAGDRAVAAMNKYEFNGANVTISRGDVRYAVNLSQFDSGGSGLDETAAKASPQNIRFVKVNVPTAAVKTFFASTVLGSTVNIGRTAVAGQSSTSVGVNEICNPMPIALIEDDVDGDSLAVVNPGQCPNTTEYTPGCVYNVNLAPPCSVDATKYIIIDEPTERCSHTDNWNKRIALGLDCVCTTDTLQVEEHITAPSIRQGINSRFNVYNGGLTSSIAPPDTVTNNNISYDTYKTTNPTTPPADSRLDRRIVILPIVRKSDVDLLDGGNTLEVQAYRYGVFFIRKKATGSGDAVADIQIEYISDSVVVGDGSYVAGGCGGSSNQQITVPVLYR